jgi:N-acetylglucosamine kinase-like BadF-type ATPase
MMKAVLGVDGGNTKTAAIVVGLGGQVLGCALGGCGDIYGTASAAAAMDTVETTALEALNRANVCLEDLAAAAFSMAGADWPEDFSFIRAETRQRNLGRDIIVVNDGIGALRAGTEDGVGIAVVCGTFVAIAAGAPSGRTWHHSWWQQPGGARELGTRTLRAVYRSELGIDPPTTLREAVLDFFGRSSVEEVLHLLTARERIHKTDVGALAPLLLDAAESGDAAARYLVEEHAAVLGDYAIAAARRVELEASPFTLALSGGVFRHPGNLHRNRLKERVAQQFPEVQIIHSRFEPVVGAALLALQSAGAQTDEHLMARLEASLPSISEFET